MVVLGEGEGGVPGRVLLLEVWDDEGRGEEMRYQFAATMGLLLMLMRLDLVFWRMRGREDLFFFFWRGRAIFWKGLGAAMSVNIVREMGFGIMKFGLI